MNISIIIPTYNRPDDLNKSIQSILNQTLLPNEIIIVDDSDENITANLVLKVKKSLHNYNINIIYIKNNGIKSITRARNIGVKISTGEIIVFLDDDVYLDKNYFKMLISVYGKYSNVKGVQGYWAYSLKFSLISRILNSTSKIFFKSNYMKDENRILPSFNNTYPFPLTKIINSDYFSGCNFSYLKSIFDEFTFDENLVKYSLGEDKDFSYRVNLKYPNSMYTTPYAKLEHIMSSTARLPNKKLVYMHYIYSIYLFNKNIKQNKYNKSVFIWSLIGELLSDVASIIYPIGNKRIINIKNFYYSISAIKYCIINLNVIKVMNQQLSNRIIFESC